MLQGAGECKRARESSSRQAHAVLKSLPACQSNIVSPPRSSSEDEHDDDDTTSTFLCSCSFAALNLNYTVLGPWLCAAEHFLAAADPLRASRPRASRVRARTCSAECAGRLQA